jgi:hypothetical protein
VLVGKVVPTLTGRSAEIYFSMAGAKQLVTLGLSWFRPGPYVQQWCARGTILRCTVVLAEGGLQARRERRPSLQIPEVLIEASANIVEKAESVQASALVLPLRPGDCPSFYRPRRRQFLGVSHCSSYVWRYDAQYNVVDGRPGESIFQRSVVACPVSAQERLRGWRC